MLLFALLLAARAKKPVLLIPGLMASTLSGSVTDAAHWYCPKDHTGLFWVDDLLMIPPEINCVFDWIRVVWNGSTNDIDELPYAHLKTGPLGDVDSVTSVDSLFGMHLLPTYQALADRFLSLGWKKNVDLLGVANDWRFGLRHKPAFWRNLTRLIEDSVSAQGERAVLVGHSMGGMFAHYFLTNVTTAEWRSKFIESAILLAPSIGGSGAAYGGLWTGHLPYLSFLGSFPETARGLGGNLIHMFNAVIYGNVTVFIDQSGQEHKGADIVRILRDNGKLPGDTEKMLGLFLPFLTAEPAPLDVPVGIVYNSGLTTTIAIDRRSGQDEFIAGRGDGLANAEGQEYCCAHWKGPYSVDCLDLHSPTSDANHLLLLWNHRVLDFVVSHTINNSWHSLTKTLF
jgi:lecithin-cholesterol acyltransferase